MKKYFLALTILFLASLSLSAQETTVDNVELKSESKSYFGLRLGIDVSCPGKVSVKDVGVSMFDNGLGVEFGGVYNIRVAEKLFIEPGLKFFYNTYSMKKDYLNSGITGISYRKSGMRIPVLVGLHFGAGKNIKLSPYTGPELEVGFTYKECVTRNQYSVSESLYGSDGMMRRVDLVWNLGMGLSVNHFFLGINFGFGMLNMYTIPDLNFHENRFTATFGYNF